MNREDIFLEVMKKYNNGEGTISELVKEYPNYTRDKFYADIKKRGIIKNPKTEQYIYDDLIEGQLDIVEVVPGAKEIVSAAAPKEVKKDSLSDTKVNQNTNGSVTKIKRTFEVDVDLVQLIKVTAALEGITINEWVNRVLRESIPLSVKVIVKG